MARSIPPILIIAFALAFAIPVFSHDSWGFPLAPIAQTGQNICWDGVGNLIDCEGTGQDGELRTGAEWPSPRFMDNGDGSVTDNLTGLVWTKDANLMQTRDPFFDVEGTPGNGAVTWQRSLDYIKKLNSEKYLGYEDWRLPNINELLSLIDHSKSYPALPAGHPFENVKSDGYLYWSSTSASNPTFAMSADLAAGRITYDNEKGIYNIGSYVWPVRGDNAIAIAPLLQTGQTDCWDSNGDLVTCNGSGQDGENQAGVKLPENRFLDNNDGTISDNATGLVWLKDALCIGGKNWPDSLTQVNLLSSGSCGLIDGSIPGDWHLPNINEIGSLMISQHPPLLPNGSPFVFNWKNNNYYPGFWSSSNCVSGAYSAWVADFMIGDIVYGYTKSGNNLYAWPVKVNQTYYYEPIALNIYPKFGTQYANITKQNRYAEIKNNSSYSTITSVIQLSGADSSEFSLYPGGNHMCTSLSPSLAAGESCTFVIAFNPVSRGNKNCMVEVTTNGNKNVIPLEGKAISTIYGTITDQSSGIAVSGASIMLNTGTTTLSNNDGFFSFGDLPDGNYTIQINKPGYQNVTLGDQLITPTTSVKIDVLMPTTGPLNITSSAIPGTTPNSACNSRINVSGGTAPYVFKIISGVLPAGVSLDSGNGVISGVASVTGSYNITIKVIDSEGVFAEKEFTFDVVTPLVITTQSLQSGRQGQPYSASILANGGKPPYSFTITNGLLPIGLNIDANGVIYGIPKEAGIFKFSINVYDSTHIEASFPITLNVNSADPLGFYTTELSPGYLGIPYFAKLTVNGGVPPYQFSFTGVLPAGIVINLNSGDLTGIPISAGLSNITFAVTDSSLPLPTTITRTISMRIWSPVNGLCGSSSGLTLTTSPTSNLCSAGTATPVNGSGPWTWTCAGTNGGTTASCSANIKTYSIGFNAGPSGSISGAATQTVKHGGQTTAVTAVPASGYHFVNWTGTDGFTSTANPLTLTNVTSSQSVTANFTADSVNGLCGSSSGLTLTTSPTSNLCSAGTATPVNGSGPWTWTCAGTNGGTTASCFANIKTATSTLSQTQITTTSKANKGTLSLFVTDGEDNNNLVIDARTTAPWITILGNGSKIRLKKGSGKGKITYSISENPSSDARSAQIQVNGATIDITQSGAPCILKSLVASPKSISSNGGTMLVTVFAPVSCEWTVKIPDFGAGWLSLQATGESSFMISAAANKGKMVGSKYVKAKSRKATITVQTQTITPSSKALSVSQVGG